VEKLQICSENYKRWKDLVLTSHSLEETKKAAKKAFFWLELHSAFLALHAIENSKKDKEMELKLIKARANLCKKLVEYANELLEELR
jgi:hypothetical protein